MSPRVEGRRTYPPQRGLSTSRSA